MSTHAAPEARRAQILDAALRCFSDKGYHSARMDDIVSASGLSKGSIYWHFESKEQIFLALFDHYLSQIFREWEEADSAEPLEALRRECQVALDRVLETRPLLEAWTEFLRHPQARRRFSDLYATSRARLAATVQRGIDAGQLAPQPPEHVAALLTAAVEGLLLQAFADPDYDARAAWPTAWSVLAAGLRPQGGSP